MLAFLFYPFAPFHIDCACTDNSLAAHLAAFPTHLPARRCTFAWDRLGPAVVELSPVALHFSLPHGLLALIPTLVHYVS